MVQQMLALTNYVIARAGFALRAAPGSLKIFAKHMKTNRKSNHLNVEAPGTIRHIVNPALVIALLHKKVR